MGIFALTGIAPNDTVLDFVLSRCPVIEHPSIIALRFVFDDGAVIETGTVHQMTSSTELGCVIVDQATPQRRYRIVTIDTAALRRRIVVNGAVDELAWFAIGGAIDAASVVRGMVVVNATIDVCGISNVIDGSTAYGIVAN